MTRSQAGFVLASVLVWAVALGSACPTLLESLQLGGPGMRTAFDVKVSREWIAMTGTVIVPQRMDVK